MVWLQVSSFGDQPLLQPAAAQLANAMVAVLGPQFTLGSLAYSRCKTLVTDNTGMQGWLGFVCWCVWQLTEGKSPSGGHVQHCNSQRMQTLHALSYTLHIHAALHGGLLWNCHPGNHALYMASQQL
jgi:hypothetical protein